MSRIKDILWGIVWGLLTIIIFLGLGLVLILAFITIYILFTDISGSIMKTAITLLLILAALTVAAILTGRRFKNAMKDARNNRDRIIIASILMVLILICFLVIYYFDIIPVSRGTGPDVCLASSGFACFGRPAIFKSENIVAFSIGNALGHDANFKDLTADRTGSFLECDPVVEICDVGKDMKDPSCSGANNFFYSLPKNGKASIYITGCDLEKSPVIKGDITLHYTNTETLLTEDVTVSITGKVKG